MQMLGMAVVQCNILVWQCRCVLLRFTFLYIPGQLTNLCKAILILLIGRTHPLGLRVNWDENKPIIQSKKTQSDVSSDYAIEGGSQAHALNLKIDRGVVCCVCTSLALTGSGALFIAAVGEKPAENTQAASTLVVL